VAENQLFENETAFYELISCLPVGISRPHVPPFHFHTNRHLVLGDMAGRGVVSYGLKDSLSVKQMKCALVEVAKLHSVGLQDTVDLAPGPVKTLGGPASDTHSHLLQDIYAGSIDSFREATSGHLDKEEWEALEQLKHEINGTLALLAQGRSPRLTHGDFWAGNLLFSEVDDCVVAVLDFQFSCFDAVPFLDVASILGSSLDCSTRRAHDVELLETYVSARTDLASEPHEQARLLHGLQQYYLPLAAAFCVGFGVDNAQKEGVLIDRFIPLLKDYCSARSRA